MFCLRYCFYCLVLLLSLLFLVKARDLTSLKLNFVAALIHTRKRMHTPTHPHCVSPVLIFLVVLGNLKIVVCSTHSGVCKYKNTVASATVYIKNKYAGLLSF